MKFPCRSDILLPPYKLTDVEFNKRLFLDLKCRNTDSVSAYKKKFTSFKSTSSELVRYIFSSSACAYQLLAVIMFPLQSDRDLCIKHEPFD